MGFLQKIVTDVTYIKHNGKWYYLAGYLDLFNNEILEWELKMCIRDSSRAMLSVKKMPNWAAAPNKNSFGFESRGSKSIIAPMPMKRLSLIHIYVPICPLRLC